METPYPALVALVVAASVASLALATTLVETEGNLITGAVTGLERHPPAILCGSLETDVLDLNEDGIVDYYDVLDTMEGRTHCMAGTCDMNGDGILDASDLRILSSTITAIYDYDGDGALTKQDQRLVGSERCSSEHVHDVNGDGTVDEGDRIRYVALLSNRDIPVIEGVTA